MGGCITSQRERSPQPVRRVVSESQSANNFSANSESREVTNGSRYEGAVAIGKNQSLKKERLRWRSQVAMTEGQLKQKREIFWETAPAYEGKKEVWDALRAAAQAAETNDWALAQAIIDGVGVSIPSGTLLDCYDELGTRYQIPPYCLSSPLNLISDADLGKDENKSTPVKTGKDVAIKLRFSDSDKDVKFPVNTEESIASLKKRVHQSVRNVDPLDQRWFFGGKLLQDRSRLSEFKIRPGYVIQIIVKAPKPASSPLS
ncbi:ubiquitin domain-containing protein 1-like [Paramacrobiotus metropolitanus]|uniref:ubiquitin domain-containing protein 1-like n=1 Tax=Paramacrobiotus metropolitanus TaxID=2943436 RepID=UPI0024458342|nr:ubiquitin domain-containing protein 1-like [Paramacrobiotus metropolitanus]XP_055343791.1 ubiquitin domain-containing protein 1-like [Paramacrobiotus metropolitanus]